MIISLIVCTLSNLLFVGYAAIKGRSLKKRCITLADKNAEHSDETLAWELKEYYHNICELGFYSAVICICALVSYILM